MLTISFRLSVFLCALLFGSQGFADNSLRFSGIKGAVNLHIGQLVLEEAYKELGINITVIPLPGERSLHTSNNGEVDGEVFRIKNIEKRYSNLIPVPTPINTLEAIAFIKNKNIAINSLEDLKKYHVGVQVGIKFAERLTAGIHKTVVDTNEQLFKMLQTGRIDIALAAETNGIKIINKLKYTNITGIKPALKSLPLYHYLHKNNAPLVSKLDTVLQKMQKRGRIKEIRQSVLNDLSR